MRLQTTEKNKLVKTGNKMKNNQKILLNPYLSKLKIFSLQSWVGIRLIYLKKKCPV